MSEFASKLKDHALQRDEKIDIIFIILVFRVKKCRYPTIGELKALWYQYEGERMRDEQS